MMIGRGRRAIPVPFIIKKDMLKKIKFLKDAKYPNGTMDKKGSVRLVTRRNAELLIALGLAELVIETEQIEPEPEVKEEKAVRQTKEEKTIRRTKKTK